MSSTSSMDSSLTSVTRRARLSLLSLALARAPYIPVPWFLRRAPQPWSLRHRPCPSRCRCRCPGHLPNPPLLEPLHGSRTQCFMLKARIFLTAQQYQLAINPMCSPRLRSSSLKRNARTTCRRRSAFSTLPRYTFAPQRLSTVADSFKDSSRQPDQHARGTDQR